MFQDANLLVLENKSTSTQKRFKIFDDQQVFPVKQLNQQIQKELDKEDKHEECDYETEEEHVTKAQQLMLEDVLDSIQYFVENKPTGLIYNLRQRRQ